MPWPLQEAIGHGLTILSWFENFSEEELPYENLWDDAEGLEEHFKALKQRREDGLSPRNRDDDSEDEMLGNDIARAFK